MRAFLKKTDEQVGVFAECPINAPNRGAVDRTALLILCVSVATSAAVYFIARGSHSGTDANQTRITEVRATRAPETLQLLDQGQSRVLHQSPRVKPEGASAGSATSIQDSSGTIAPWPEAKALMREEFLISKGQLDLISDEIMSIYPRQATEGIPGRRFSLEDDPVEEWTKSLFVDGKELTLTEVDKIAIKRKSQEAIAVLSTLRDDAQSLLGDALLTYWEGDMGYPLPGGKATDLPAEFWKSRGGQFSMKTSASGGGWQVFVHFDSADFPVLDYVFTEADRVKRQLCLDINSISSN